MESMRGLETLSFSRQSFQMINLQEVFHDFGQVFDDPSNLSQTHTNKQE